MGKYLNTSILHKGHIKTPCVLIWHAVEFVTQWLRALVALLSLPDSAKCIFQPKNIRFHTGIVILTICAALTDTSLANNSPPTNPYKAQDYMLDLATKLSPQQRDLLLRGQNVQDRNWPAEKPQTVMPRFNTVDQEEMYRRLMGEEPIRKEEQAYPQKPPIYVIYDPNMDNAEKFQKDLLSAAMTGEEPSMASIAAEEAWSLSKDLDKYRAYAVKEGSREPNENLTKALENAGFSIVDGINAFTLGYTSDRGLKFRENDGYDPTWQIETVGEQGGQVIVNLLDGFYSIFDLMALDLLDDLPKDVYKDNAPVIRPLLFAGRTIGSTWKTTENIGNTLTWGYFDNFSGSAAMCIGDIVETLKHTGQAVTNSPRGLVYLVVGKDENTDQMLDWILVVPWELASNIIEMQGISNTLDYRTAFREKGVVGSMLELAGAGVITYKTIDEIFDEIDDHHHKDKKSTSQSQQSNPPSGSGGGDSGGEDTSDGAYYFFGYYWGL